MGSIYRKNDKWYVRFKDGHGRWRDTATQATTKTEAKSLLHDLEIRADRQRRGLEPLPEHQKPMTFGEVMDAWKNEVGSRLRSTTIIGFGEKHFRESLGHLPLKEVTASRLEVLITQKAGELAPESRNHLRALAHRIFAWAARRGLWTGLNPAKAVPRIKKPKKLPQYLKAEEVPLMLAALERRWRPLFATAVYTGMRKGELLALRKSDVDLPGGTITVARSHASETTKGGHADLLPIAEGLVPFLREALATSSSELVFPREDGSQHPPDLALHKVLRRALGRAGLVESYRHVCRRKGCGHAERKSHAVSEPCPRCGMKLWPRALPRPLRFHDLRHTTATLLLKAGVPLATVQRILRHSDPATTTEIYGHLDVEDMRKGLNQLAFRTVAPASLQEVPPALLAAGAEPSPLAASLLLEGQSPKGEGPGAHGQVRETPGPSMVGATGFEPATTCTPSKCATRLRYAPALLLPVRNGPPLCPHLTPASSGSRRQPSENRQHPSALPVRALFRLELLGLELVILVRILVPRVDLRVVLRRRLAVQRALEHLARPEGQHPAGRDLDLLTRLRVTPHPRLLLPHLEVPEPGDLDLVPALQRLLQGVEDQLDDLRRLLLGEADLLVDAFDDVRLRHTVPRENAALR